MAKFKEDKQIKTRKRLNSGELQIEDINNRVKKFEYKDLAFSILYVIVAALFICALVYAGIAIMN